MIVFELHIHMYIVYLVRYLTQSIKSYIYIYLAQYMQYLHDVNVAYEWEERTKRE